MTGHRRAAIWAAFEVTLAGLVVGVVLAPGVALVALLVVAVAGLAAQIR